MKRFFIRYWRHVLVFSTVCLLTILTFWFYTQREGIFAEVVSLNTTEFGLGREFKVNPNGFQCSDGGGLRDVAAVSVIFPEELFSQPLNRDIKKDAFSGECTFRFVYYGHGEGRPLEGLYRFLLKYRNGDTKEILSKYDGAVMPSPENVQVQRKGNALEASWNVPQAAFNIGYLPKMIVFADQEAGRKYFQGDLISVEGEENVQFLQMENPPLVDGELYRVHVMLSGDSALSDDFVEITW